MPAALQINVNTETHTDDLDLLLSTLPQRLQDVVRELQHQELLEIVLDLGRPPQVRLPGQAINLSDAPVSRDDVERVAHAVGDFGADNRAGIEGTLHRISAIRNRRGEIVGLTLRVGRAVFGTIDVLRDLIESGKSILLLGRPGVGKTTKLREVARVLADEFGKRVVVIDTSNEIAGDGDIPHPAIGNARRMQVPHPQEQHAVMIEAVENHMPEVIIVDEIGTSAETLAARTIAERGVQLVGTAHGNTLENLVQNPTLAELVGGVQTVTLGDEEARLRGTQKTVIERKGPPPFDAVVELVNRDEVIVHADTGAAVDRLLRGRNAAGSRRSGALPSADAESAPAPTRPQPGLPFSASGLQGPVRIYPYALSRDSVERVLRDLRVDARTVNRPERANLILTLRARASDPRLQRLTETTGIPVHVVKKNTTAQIRRLLQNVLNVVYGAGDDEVDATVRETEHAIQRVLEDGVAMALTPRPASLRKLQHRIVARHSLIAESVGSEPDRHLVIQPGH